MRLDLFLKASRLVLRRSLAQDLCDAGFVKVNNLPAKSSKEIKPDDLIELRRRHRILTLKVVRVPDHKQVSRNDAASLYEVISEEAVPGSSFDVSLDSE
jgi:ribosomal 50S subunit-recycling heat shock protein